LQDIFAEQYALAFTPKVEIRYTAPDEDCNTTPYEWHI
jgi:hypothetical protein